MISSHRKSLTLLMFFVFILTLIILLPAPSRAAGTVTYTVSDPMDGKARIITFTATADASAHTFPDASTKMSETMGWWLCSMETNPGSTAPTDDYDIVINTAGGADILGGAGANRDTSNTEIAYPTVDATSGQKSCVPINSALTLSISGNSVNSATTVIKLDLRRQ